MKAHDIATAADWRRSSRARRLAHAEPLRLPSGATILAVRPEPLEWILAGRVPQRLLAAALTAHGGESAPARELSREDVLELARFAAQLVEASVIEPAIGEGPDEIALDDIPIEDRAFIFEWACRALGGVPSANPARGTGASPVAVPGQDGRATSAVNEERSSPSDGLERFCAK